MKLNVMGEVFPFISLIHLLMKQKSIKPIFHVDYVIADAWKRKANKVKNNILIMSISLAFSFSFSLLLVFPYFLAIRFTVLGILINERIWLRAVIVWLEKLQTYKNYARELVYVLIWWTVLVFLVSANNMNIIKNDNL